MSNRIFSSKENGATRMIPKEKDKKDAIIEKMRFLDNYNLWLETRHVGMRVRVLAVGLGIQNDVQFDGIVSKEGHNSLAIDIDFRTGMKGRVLFFKSRTESQGYPKAGELFIVPTKEEAGLLAARLHEMTMRSSAGKLGDEQVFEFDPYTMELVRE